MVRCIVAKFHRESFVHSPVLLYAARTTSREQAQTNKTVRRETQTNADELKRRRISTNELIVARKIRLLQCLLPPTWGSVRPKVQVPLYYRPYCTIMNEHISLLLTTIINEYIVDDCLFVCRLCIQKEKLATFLRHYLYTVIILFPCERKTNKTFRLFIASFVHTNL